ncbi:MAG: carboxypeptidase-like regulatory domain-containing protein [Candidatus Pedobacter colombiensis]|uniref:Carboxypeptidase-like regulatory domain-containing protein n=1 Tax=Candidatus Pedobacter colombiensis TaxID=3121371 RepID=A0AAJ6B6Q3_9SPHI|nr:carboxypeptidase-like regulatory domain-containing protein [Pedobacter sp.]WEK20267.1 MAG: carboxypeptidase-like regulatory domain-containing protein [Pedobacter sp.]
MTKSLLILFLTLFTGLHGFSQNSFSIMGVVRDQKESLPGAGIFLSGYQVSTVADNEGKFKISNLKPGNYDLLVQMVGYLPYSKSVIISDKSVQVELVLKESTTVLNEVVIHADPNRAKYIKQFKEYFIGTTPNAAQCKILNPQVLNIDYDATKSLLTIKTSDFLVIENKALGYRIKYMLDYFEYNSRTRIIYFSGHPFFEELKGPGAKMKKYIDKREVAYYGSSQHFFRSLYQGKAKEEGFIINKMVKIPNPYRYPDSIIYKNLTRLKTPGKSSTITKNTPPRDSAMISFWLKQQDMPKTIDCLDRTELSADNLIHTYNQNLKSLDCTGSLAISYTRERESLEYSKTGFWIFRPLDVPDYEISVANLMQGSIRFYENGGIYDSRAMLYEGFWAYEKVGDMVPMDYIPLSKK